MTWLQPSSRSPSSRSIATVCVSLAILLLPLHDATAQITRLVGPVAASIPIEGVLRGLLAGLVAIRAGRPDLQAGRLLASIGLVAWAAAMVLGLTHSPGTAFTVLLTTVGLVAALLPVPVPTPLVGTARCPLPLLAPLVALGVGVARWQAGVPELLVERAVSVLLYATPAVGILLAGRRHGLVWTALLLAPLPLFGSWVPSLSPLAMLGPVLLVGWALTERAVESDPREAGRATALDLLLLHPSRALVVSFLVMCGVGTLLLALPASTHTGDPLSWLDAAFTAVSATCVTGLIVVDTPVAFSLFGELVVLLLIQVGGIGIMVFSAAGIFLLGQRLSIQHERVAAHVVGARSRKGLWQMLRTVLVVTFGTEALAAIALTAAFLRAGDPPLEACWRGVFTAISAFCNAGFALQSDSLVSYADDPFVLWVVMLAIVLGGLGPAVVAALFQWRDPLQRTLHTRLVLVSTALLVVGPALLFLALEWDNTLAGMSVLDRITNGVFQSVTLRTAGFNSVDLAAVHPATWVVLVVLMFVGGSPGSTAGGVKTTTLAVVCVGVWSVMRQRSQVTVFGRAIPTQVVLRSATLVAVAIGGVLMGVFSLLLTQDIALPVATFEVVSALATVGLTTGGTAALDEVGKVIVIACMFVGRVGLLTLFVSFTTGGERPSATRLPHAPVPVG